MWCLSSDQSQSKHGTRKQPEEKMKAASAPDGKEDASDGSESDLVSEEEEELESDSQTDCSDE